MLKVKEYANFDEFEKDAHKQDVDLVAIVNKPNGMVCADLITDCRCGRPRSTASSRHWPGMSALMAGRRPSRSASRKASGRTRR